jgi:regulator of replication initiation timing
MHRYGRPVQTTLLRAVAAIVLLSCTAAMAAPDPKAEAKAKKGNPAEIAQRVDQIVETQQSLALALAHLREQLAETEHAAAEQHGELREKHDASQAVLDQVLEQVKGMREEVRGLYVETSGLKGDIAQAGKQVEGLDQSLGSFRLSAGIVVAVVIVLQFVLVGLAFRGRG